MPAAVPIVGVNSIVKFTPQGGTEVTLKNSKWSLSKKANIKDAPNTSDGMVRAKGIPDFEGSVEGFTDTSDPIEGDVQEGTIGTLKLYRDSTKFYSMSVIIGDFDIETGVDDLETWTFSFMKSSGTVTNPV